MDIRKYKNFIKVITDIFKRSIYFNVYNIYDIQKNNKGIWK